MRFLAALLSVLIMGGPAMADDPAAKAERDRHNTELLNKGLVVHEWGVATYVQGREGGRLDQARENASDLPPFVVSMKKLKEARPVPGVDIIIDKPIVYFYTPKPETITFTVACPKGLFTEWYPKSTKVEPSPETVDEKAAPAGALLQWRNFDVTPVAQNPLPDAGKDAWWWPICRDTDAATINADGQLEKFIFYHGTLGDAPPLLTVEGGGGQKYIVTNSSRKESIRQIALVYVSQGKATAQFLQLLKPGETQKVDLAMPPDAPSVDKLAEDLATRTTAMLGAEGLFNKEAVGMLRIWRKPWFEKEGVRVLYLNPPQATSSLLPVSIDPQPVSLVRTLMIGVECLTDSKDNIVKALIQQLGDGNYAQRKAAQDKLIEMGRQIEAPLKEALKKTEDEDVRASIELILRKFDPRSSLPDTPVPNDSGDRAQ